MRGDGIFSQPFRMVEPPPPVGVFFSPKVNEPVPRPPKRTQIIPRPVFKDGTHAASPYPPRAGSPHRHGRRTPSSPRAAASARTPHRGTRARATSPVADRDSPAVRSARQAAASPGPRAPPLRPTSPLDDTKLRPPAVVGRKTAVAKPRDTTASGEDPPLEDTGDAQAQARAWAPTGFDFMNTTIQRALLRIQGIDSLDAKWRMLSDLLQQFGVDADANLYSVALSSFLDSMKARCADERLPNHTMTCTGCVVIDQLLLLLKRTFPHLSQVVMAARALVLQSIFIIPNQEADILPFDNVTDQYEVQEQLDRFNKKAYFQSTRELSARVHNDATAYEHDEVTRENQSACVNRIVDHWQGQFKLMLLKAWRCYHRQQKEAVKTQERETGLRDEIRALKAELQERDKKIAGLEDTIKRIQDTSEILKKLEGAIQGKLLLQKEVDMLTRNLADSKLLGKKLESAMKACVQTLRDIGLELKKDAAPGPTLELIEGSLIDVERANAMTDNQLVDLFNTIIESSTHYTPEHRVMGLTEGHALLDPFLILAHLTDPALISPAELTDAMELKDYTAKANRLVELCGVVGAGISVPGQCLVAPSVPWLHLSILTSLLARLCDPASRADTNAKRALQSFVAGDLVGRGGHRENEVAFDFAPDPDLVVSLVDSEAQKLRELVRKSFKCREAAFSAYRLSLNTTLEKLVGMSSKVFTISETVSIESFCNPAAILQEDDPALRDLLVNNYRLLRLLFLEGADGSTQTYSVDALWELLNDSYVCTPQTGFTHEHFNAIIERTVEVFGIDGWLTDTQWVYVLVQVGEELARIRNAGTKNTTPRHEGMYSLLCRHLFCHSNVVDVTEFKEAVHRLDVQEVLHEYTVHLHKIFEHYSDERKARINLNRYIAFIEECGLVNGKDPTQRKDTVSVCCAMYQTLRDSVGRIHTDRAVNFYLFVEIVCCLAVYDSADMPYLPIAAAVRRFCESRLLRQLPQRISALRNMNKHDPIIRKSSRMWSRRSLFGLQDFVQSVPELISRGGSKRKSFTTLNVEESFADANTVSQGQDAWLSSSARRLVSQGGMSPRGGAGTSPRARTASLRERAGSMSPVPSPRASERDRKPSFLM